MTSWHERLNAVLKEQNRSANDLVWFAGIVAATAQRGVTGTDASSSCRDITVLGRVERCWHSDAKREH